MTSNTAPLFASFAMSFAEALAADDFVKAHGMLGVYLGNSVQPDHLRQTYKAMVDYGDGPVSDMQLMHTMEDWPAKQASDLGWAYVSLSGEEFAEAVTVVVAQEGGSLVIRDLEWGRP